MILHFWSPSIHLLYCTCTPIFYYSFLPSGLTHSFICISFKSISLPSNLRSINNTKCQFSVSILFRQRSQICHCFAGFTVWRKTNVSHERISVTCRKVYIYSTSLVGKMREKVLRMPTSLAFPQKLETHTHTHMPLSFCRLNIFIPRSKAHPPN